MTSRLIALSMSLSVLSCATPANERPPTSAPVIDVRASEGSASDEDVRVVRERALIAHPKLISILGADRVPVTALVIRLEGDGGPGKIPSVDPVNGDILLYRFPGEGYEASLVHEMVHALRRHLWTEPARQTGPFLFLEEGLAEVVAIDAGSPSSGFPLYGAPLAVAAGQWLARDEDIPIGDLVRRHGELNFACMPQAYTLRLSFMAFLRERHGLAPLLALAYADAPLTDAAFAKELGAPLDDLATAWRTWASAQYTATADADAQATHYRRESPVQYFPVCARDGSPKP